MQRGSVQYLSIYPGDPSTRTSHSIFLNKLFKLICHILADIPAYGNATRVDGTNIPTIPSLPISWANAERLLEELGGLEAGRLLSGKYSKALVKLTNHGMHAKTIRMKSANHFLQWTQNRRRFGIHMLPFQATLRTKSSWWVITEMVRIIEQTATMLLTFSLAWVMGAADPTSGTVSLHEVVRGLSVLLKSGWKPLRTIVFASWDAEEVCALSYFLTVYSSILCSTV